jgi:hypothetical protein
MKLFAVEQPIGKCNKAKQNFRPTLSSLFPLLS